MFANSLAGCNEGFTPVLDCLLAVLRGLREDNIERAVGVDAGLVEGATCRISSSSLSSISTVFVGSTFECSVFLRLAGEACDML